MLHKLPAASKAARERACLPAQIPPRSQRLAGWVHVLAAIGLCGCSHSVSPTPSRIDANPPVAVSHSGAPTSVNCGDASGRWVTAWQSVPTDAMTPVDSSATPLLVGPAQTFRAILTPLGGGDVVRVRISNRFGSSPVVFTKLRIAKRVRGASIDAASSVPVTFGCQAGLTIPAGGDVISDPVAFPIDAFDDIAISIAASDPGVTPTQHFTARQTSYATAPGMGDHADDADASAFIQHSTARAFVTGLDVRTDSASAIVAFGDSITDGYQSPPSVFPQDTTAIDLNQRYPDFLKRRIDAAGLPLFVSNAGISGNRVVTDGQIAAFGRAAITRVTPDVLTQSGVSTVIWLEGINDFGQDSAQTEAAVIAGYIQVITQLQTAGLRVLQGTLTPCGNNALYGSASNNAKRAAVNEWIRTQSPADAVIDFDLAVRDANNPDVIAAAYDGGDGLHFNAAGYERLAQAIDLDLLQAPR